MEEKIVIAINRIVVEVDMLYCQTILNTIRV